MTLQKYLAGGLLTASLFAGCSESTVYAPSKQDSELSRHQEESTEPRPITINRKASPFTIYSDGQLREELGLDQTVPYDSLTATANQLTILNPPEGSPIPSSSDTPTSYSFRKQNLTDQDTFYVRTNGSDWMQLEGRTNNRDMFLADDFKFLIAGREGQNTLELLTTNPNESEILYLRSEFTKL